MSRIHSPTSTFTEKGGFAIRRTRLIASLGLATLFVLAVAGSAAAKVVPKTQSHSQAVDVLFEPTLSGGGTYKVYRHQRTDDGNVDFQLLGSVTVDGAGNISSQSCNTDGPTCFEVVQPDVNSSKYVVFHDGNDAGSPVQDYREYYYLVTENVNFNIATDDITQYNVVSAFPPNQTRHGSYTEFTGACTGCHGLHSAQSNQKLLKGPTVADLCGICHDGSVSKYDVVRGKVLMENNNYAPEPAGPFGKQLIDDNAGDPNAGYNWASSVHNIYRAGVNNWATVYFAPGTGFRPNTNQPDVTKATYGSGTDFSPIGWGNQLSCISCHEPHNKPMNFRLLRNDIADGANGDGTPAAPLAVRGLSETGVAPAGTALWPQAYSDFNSVVGGQVYISQTKFLANTAKFCSQCHRAFYNKSIRVVDDRVLTSMFNVANVSNTTVQGQIRAFFRDLNSLYATGVPTSSAVNALLGGANHTAVTNNCSGCHRIVAETIEADGSASEVVITNNANEAWKVYVGWTTGNRNLDRGSGALLSSVMGKGHRHPTEVPAHRVRLSGKVIDLPLNACSGPPVGPAEPTYCQKQIRVKPGPVNVGVPLEGRYAGDSTSIFTDFEYTNNAVVCLTCHMAHGSRTGVNDSARWTSWFVGDKYLESGYDNAGLNGLIVNNSCSSGYAVDYNNDGDSTDPDEGCAAKNAVSGYWRNVATTPASGVSTVLARFAPMASVCFRCHSTQP